MKNIIYLIFTLLSTYSYAQVNIVFKLGKSITNSDKVLFMEKAKFVDNVFYIEKKIALKENTNDKTYSLIINEPTVILLAITPNINKYHEVYLNVSDTIEINKLQLKSSPSFYLDLKGRKVNYAQYNFNNQEEIWNEKNPPPSYSEVNNLVLHKKNVQEWITLKKKNYNDYFALYGASKDFTSFINQKIKCEYTFGLLTPIFYDIYDFPENYMDGEIVGDDNSRLYIVASDLYIRWYKEGLKYNLKKMQGHIEKSYNGKTKEYLLSVMIGLYADGDGTDSKEYLETADYYQSIISQKTYKEFISSAKQYFIKNISTIPDSILQNTLLLSINGKKTNLYEVLKNNSKNGKQIIMDFWASWCGPCIKDIKESKALRENLLKDNIFYIFLSMDKNNVEWTNSAKKLNIEINQYLILDIQNSPILKYLKINSIPRYIYIGNDFLIKNLNGRPPLPQHTKYFKDTFSIN